MTTSATGMSQTDVVVYGIKKMIVDGTLASGERLPVEKDLATELGVSRSSLREGVRALSMMGVLESRQGAGTYVTNLDASLLLGALEFVVDLQDARSAESLHAVRRVLETEAAGLAARLISDDQLDEAGRWLDRSEAAMAEGEVDHSTAMECDVQFHRIIASASANPVLAALIEALASRTIRGRLWRAIRDDQAQHTTLAEHRAILTALRQREPERARFRMANHLLAVEEFLHDAPVAD
jgi:DNA-binding FadR family transcriptional regulator